MQGPNEDHGTFLNDPPPFGGKKDVTLDAGRFVDLEVRKWRNSCC